MRILYLFALGFAAACGGWLYVGISASFWWIPLLISIACLPVLLYFRHRAFALAGVLLFGCGIGLLRCNFAAPPPLSALSEGNVTITCRDYSWENTYGVGCEGTMEVDGKQVYVRVYLRDAVSLSPGDKLTGSFRISESNQTLKAKKIFLTASQSGGVDVETSGEGSLRYFGQNLKHACEGVLRSVLPENAQPFALGLLMGETYELDHTTDLNLRIAGVRHMVAVSGMHISILFLLISLLAGKQRWVMTAVGVPLLLIFVWMVGFTPSVMRAAMVEILILLALVADRRFDNLTAIGVAALALLLENPYAIASVGFQLSFAGALGIAVFARKLQVFLQSLLPEKLNGKVRSLLSRAILVASMTTAASVFTIPLTAVYFGCVSLIGIVSNLLLTPFMTVLFYGLLLSALLGVVWMPLGIHAGKLTGLGVEAFLWITAKLASIPFAAVYTTSVYITLWLVLSYIMVFFLLRKKAGIPAVAAVAALLAAALLMSRLEPKTAECQVDVLDVGQGQCILLQSGENVFLVDCGGDSGENAADLAAEMLITRGVYELDALIVSHIDADHSGGVPYLLERVDTKALYLPEYGEYDGFLSSIKEADSRNINLLREDADLQFSNCTVSIFCNAEAKTSNESSLCVLFQTENCDILITGDLPASADPLLIGRERVPELELLVVGHHGAANSTSAKLLEATSPEIAVISVGENSYGHPSEKTLKRLYEAGCEVFRTDVSGTITFRR